MAFSLEQKNTEANPREELNQQNRDQLVKNFAALGLRTKNSAAGVLPLNENNSAFLSAETHTLPAEKNGTNFTGCAGATIANSTVNITESFTNFNNISFVTPVSIASNASVIFNGCRFAQTTAMTAGARAHFVGCYFYNQGSVQNAGLAANAYIVGCVRKSGIANLNVTVISETT
jgi:hypothetical protein